MTDIRIGDRVRGKTNEEHNKAPGIAVAILHPEYFLVNSGQEEILAQIWDKKHPQWKEKPVVIVYHKEAELAGTMQEWIAGNLERGVSEEEARQTYEANCPRSNEIAFPHDDLERIL